MESELLASDEVVEGSSPSVSSILDFGLADRTVSSTTPLPIQNPKSKIQNQLHFGVV